MAHQPSYRPLRAEPVLRGRSLVAAARRRAPWRAGNSRSATPFYTGEMAVEVQQQPRLPASSARGRQSPWMRQAGGGTAGLMPTRFRFRSLRGPGPRPGTLQHLLRALPRPRRHRPWHDRRSGYTPPPSFHTDLSRGFRCAGHQRAEVARRRPVGYYYEVVSNGFGAMPAYRKQIPPADRWAIIAYIRALQLSQHASVGDVRDAKEQAKLLLWEAQER